MYITQRCKSSTNEFRLHNVNFESTTHFNWVDAFGVTTNRFGFDYNRMFMFRLLSTIIIFTSFVISIFSSIDKGCIKYWIIYFTHWTVCITVTYSISGLYITYKLHNFPDEFSSHIVPRFVRFHWVLVSPVFVASITVPILFWFSCLLTDTPNDYCIPHRDPNSMLLHGVNSILVISDIIISKQPFMVLHGFYPFAIGCVYLFFTYIHHVLEIGTCAHPNVDYPIYSEFNWNNGYNIYTGSIVLLGIPIVNFLGWYTYYRKLRRDNQYNVQLITYST